MECLVDIFTHLLVLKAVEKEDKDTLETVQNGEDVGHGDRRLAQVKQTECPRQAQQEDQHERSTNPNSVVEK